jgi:hypothetical protein
MTGAGESRVLANEKLTGMSDCNSWAYAMQMYLIHEDLMDYVTGNMAASKKNYSTETDKKTLSKIALMNKPELYSHTKKADAANEAWDALREAFAPSDTSGKRYILKRLFTASSLFPPNAQLIQKITVQPRPFNNFQLLPPPLWRPGAELFPTLHLQIQQKLAQQTLAAAQAYAPTNGRFFITSGSPM